MGRSVWVERRALHAFLSPAGAPTSQGSAENRREGRGGSEERIRASGAGEHVGGAVSEEATGEPSGYG